MWFLVMEVVAGFWLLVVLGVVVMLVAGGRGGGGFGGGGGFKCGFSQILDFRRPQN